jgi:hypothetical protein
VSRRGAQGRPGCDCGRSRRYQLVVIDAAPGCGWTVPLVTNAGNLATTAELMDSDSWGPRHLARPSSLVGHYPLVFNDRTAPQCFLAGRDGAAASGVPRRTPRDSSPVMVALFVGGHARSGVFIMQCETGLIVEPWLAPRADGSAGRRPSSGRTTQCHLNPHSPRL